MRNNHLLLLAFLFVILPVLPLRGQEVKKIAILETVDREDAVSYGIKLMVRSSLSYAITNTPGYEGYDRVDLASIVGEHDFQRTGMVSDSQIKQLGVMTGASYILVAETAMIDASNIFITAKILNVETAKLERMASTQSGIKANEIDEKCKELAASLFGDKSASQNPETKGIIKGLFERKQMTEEEKAEILREKEERRMEMEIQQEKYRLEREKLKKEEEEQRLQEKLKRKEEIAARAREREEKRVLRWDTLMSKKVRYEGLVSYTLGVTDGVGYGVFTSHGIRFVKPRIVLGVSGGFEHFDILGSSAYDKYSLFAGVFPKWYFVDNGKVDAYIACHVGYVSIWPEDNSYSYNYFPYSGIQTIPEIGVGFKNRSRVAFDFSVKGHIYGIGSTISFYPNFCFGIRF